MEARSLVLGALRLVLMRWASVSLLAFFCALLLLPGVVLAQTTSGMVPDVGGSGTQWHKLCESDGTAPFTCRVPYAGTEPLSSVRVASCFDDGVTQECFYRTLQDFEFSCWDEDDYCPAEVDGSDFVITLPAWGSIQWFWACTQTLGPCFPGDPSSGGDPEPEPDPDPSGDSAALLAAAQEAAQAASWAAEAASAAGSLLFGLLGLGFGALGFFGYSVGARDA